MITVVEGPAHVFEEAVAGDVTSLDGQRRAPLDVILHESWTADERAAFGIYLVRPAAVPPGKVVTAVRYARTGNEVIQLLDLADAPVIVPVAVSPRQLRLALLGAGMLDQVSAFVAGANVPPAARISWEYATEYRRDDPMLNAMAQQLQPPLSEAQIDRLFIAAAAIA